jgi:hypothetical protein
LHQPQPLEPRQRVECLAVAPVGQHEGGGVTPVGQPPHLYPDRGELGGHDEGAGGDGGDHARRTVTRGGARSRDGGVHHDLPGAGDSDEGRSHVVPGWVAQVRSTLLMEISTASGSRATRARVTPPKP